MITFRWPVWEPEREDSPRHRRQGRAAGLCGGRCGSGPFSETPQLHSPVVQWSLAAPERGRQTQTREASNKPVLFYITFRLFRLFQWLPRCYLKRVNMGASPPRRFYRPCKIWATREQRDNHKVQSTVTVQGNSYSENCGCMKTKKGNRWQKGSNQQQRHRQRQEGQVRWDNPAVK